MTSTCSLQPGLWAKVVCVLRTWLTSRTPPALPPATQAGAEGVQRFMVTHMADGPPYPEVRR